MKTTHEIIEIMKQAHDAMLEYEKAIQSGRVDYNEEEERELESWSGSLRCAAGTLNNRIIFK